MTDRSILLIGMPGCGKTTIGRRVAELTDRPFYDLDETVVELSGHTIPELFAQSEDYFRDWETKACLHHADTAGAVLSAGGGIVKRPENLGAFRGKAIIVFLDRTCEDILSDLDESGRPLLKNDRERIYRLYEERYQLYCTGCDVRVENNAPLEEICNRILQIMEQSF